MKYTIKDFRKQFPDDDACLDFLFKARFGAEYICPKCGHKDCFYRVKDRKTYSCSWCGKHISPTAGTIFHKSETPLSMWFHTAFLMSQSKNGVAAKEVERLVGVTYKTALRMTHKIRSLMAQEPSMFGGTVEMDETYVGGRRRGKRGRGALGKTVVFGISHRESGQVIAKVVPNVKEKTLMPLVRDNVKIGTTVMTDEMGSYRKSKKYGYKHRTVRHAAKEYVRGKTHTNSIEGFWGQLKRSSDGTHHSVSGKHLQRYVDEHVFKWNRRTSETPLLSVLLGRV